ncbi:hypothetical protein V8E53_004786 [Lactarius tabidus]
MPRARYDIVPESGTEIIEEVTYHQKTKRGTKLKTTRTVVKQPIRAKAQTTSRSQSRARKKVQASESEEEPIGAGDNNDNQTYDVVGDLEYQLQHAADEEEPLATSPMDQWLERRSKYLNYLLEMEGHQSSLKCSLCLKGSAYIKCSDCFGGNMFCKGCCLQHHSRSPFHRLLQWNGRHYVATSLYSMGFILFLGHSGDPCPKTVEGAQAAKTRATPRHRTRASGLSLLEQVSEDYTSADQLPTPRETPQPEDTYTAPTISNSLFDHLDDALDNGYADAHRSRTGRSGNPLLTVVDCQGVFTMEVLFCACSDRRSKEEQLLGTRLFPATFKQIETVFSFAVLDNFLVDNLECKTTAQQYFSKLQSMTSTMFPDYVQNRYKQLLRASRQWRDLKNRMKSGLGHKAEQETSEDGSMSIFCPACPQPGVNLPNDWKTKYSPNELIRTFIMDGNFSAEHMRYQTTEKDVSLSPGMAFMANPDLYKTHLQSGAEMIQVENPNTCNTYKAIEQANSSRPHLDVTGIGAAACCHGFFVPTSVVDFQKGERQINMDFSICKALSYNMKDIPVALLMYDIMCQYRVNFKKRIKKSPELSLPSSLELRTGIGLFHIHGHQDSCLPRYSPSFIPGAKQVDGEIIETLWAPLNNISRSLRGMTLAHRQEVLDSHMNHSNWKKMVRIVPALLKRWKRLQPGLELSAEAFINLSKRFKEQNKIWLAEDKVAQQKRHNNPGAMDIYDTSKSQAPTRAAIQQVLISEEDEEGAIHGQTSWLSCGLKIQEMQLAIRYDLRLSGPQPMIEKAQVIDNKHSRLQRFIDMFERQADSYILRHRALENAQIAPLTDYSQFDDIDMLDDLEPQVPVQASPHAFHYISHSSDSSGIDSTNAEDLSIILPSSLGWEWCIQNNVQNLAEKEAKLHVAQANDAVHGMRLALGFKSALFRGQRTKTRAWDAVHSTDATVNHHARNYSMAREAYLQIQQAYSVGPELPQLCLADLRVGTAILDPAEVRQRNTQLSWIWSFGETVDKDGTWMDEFNRVHWLRAKAQFERWLEEQASIHNEAVWVPAYFHSKAEQWEERMKNAAQYSQKGHAAYASQQMHSWEELSKSSEKSLAPITSTPVKTFRTAALYLK